jgi:hypothetical protein
LLAVHVTANGDQLFPKVPQIYSYRLAVTIFIPQFINAFTFNNKRYPLPLILHHLGEAALTAQKKGG